MKKVHLFIMLLFASFMLFAQVGVGTTNPDASAELDLKSNNKGFLPPRIADETGIANPATGLVIYNTTKKCLQVNVGTPTAADWKCMGGAAELPENAPLRPISTPDGRTWLSSNLGTTATALTITDISPATQGSLYQWGRNTDGHENPNSSESLGPVANPTAAGSNFVLNTDTNSNTNRGWLTTVDNSRWNSGNETNPVKTANDPCPAGYRVPTLSEWEALDTALENSLGAVPTKQDYFNLLHIINHPHRVRDDGDVDPTSNFSPFMTSTSTTSNGTFSAFFISSSGGGNDSNRGMADGMAVRCINE